MTPKERYEKRQKSNTSLSPKERFEKKKERENRKSQYESTIKFDTLQTDSEYLGTVIKDVYSGWQKDGTMKTIKPAIQSMYNRLTTLQEYRKEFGITNDEDDEKEFKDLIEGYKQTLDGWDELTTDYGQYKSSKEYYDAVEEGKKEEREEKAMATADLSKVRIQIDKLKSDLDTAKKMHKEWEIPVVGMFDEATTKKTGRITYYNNPQAQKLAEQARDNTIKQEFGYSIEELEEKYSKEEAKYKRAEFLQSGLKLVKDAQNSEYFDDWAQKGAALPYDDFGDVNVVGGGGHSRPVRKIDKYRAASIALYKKQGNENPVGNYSVDQTESIDKYGLMTEDEFKNFAFYLQYDKENGTRKAYEYIDSIEETLNIREGLTIAQKYENSSTLSKVLYGFGAGLDQFASGMSSAFNTTDDYIPTTSTQFAAQNIRRGMYDEWADLPDWMGGGSLGQAAFDTAQSIGNMAPSMAAGAVSNFVVPGSGVYVSSALMGTSAHGNAYQEMLNQGYSKTQSRTYATLVGVSEATLNYFLDGVMGGKATEKAIETAIKGIDKGFLRFAVRWGMSGASEIPEEFLQSVLDPIFQNIAVGYELNDMSEFDWSQAVYEGLLGGASGLLLGGGRSATSTISEQSTWNRAGKNTRANNTIPNVLDIAQLTPQDSDAYATYTRYANKGINADNITDTQIGRLYDEANTYAKGVLSSKKSTVAQKENATKILNELSKADEKSTIDKETLTNVERSVAYEGALHDSVDALIESGLESAENTESHKLAVKLQNKIRSGEEISTQEIVKLQEANEVAIAQEVKTIALENGIAEDDVQLFESVYDGNEDVSAFATDFNRVKALSMKGVSQDSILQEAKVLTPSQVGRVYSATRKSISDTNKKIAQEQQSKLDAITKKYSGNLAIKGKINDSIIDYTNSTKDGSKVNWFSLTPTEQNEIMLVKALSQVMGANLDLNKSKLVNGSYKGANGQYDGTTNTITMDVYAGRISANALSGEILKKGNIISSFSHETTHWGKHKAPELYNSLRENTLDFLEAATGKDRETLISEEIARIKKAHPELKNVDEEYAVDELIARTCEDMLSNSKTAREMLSKLTPQEQKTFIEKVKELITNFIKWIDDVLGIYPSNSKEAKLLRENKAEFENMLEIWDEMLAKAVETNQALQHEGIIAENLVNGISKDGTTIVGKNNIQMSERTYAEGGRDFLANWLEGQDLSKEDKQDILYQTDAIAALMKDIRENNELPDYARWAEMDVVKDENGDKVLSVIVKNGDYAMNIDFSQVCKKRVALNAVLNAMVQSGDLNAYILTETDVAELNAIIKKHEFEIACALCFVDSKRYRVGSWAESFCEGADKKKSGKMVHQYGFNEMVRSLVPKDSKIQIDEFNFTNREIVGQPTSNLLSEMDDSKLDFTLIDEILKREYNEGKKPTDLYAYAKAIKDNPSLRKILNPAEIISSIGLDAIRLEMPELYRLINRHQGTARPKFAHDTVAYTNDVLMASNFTKEKAKMVGGVRCQSFSDFMANMVFDYVQFISELAAKELTSHTYTKEPLFVRLFGLTGMKINMSLVPKAVEMNAEQQKQFAILYDEKANKRSTEYKKAKNDYKKLTENAGLDENGNYIWEDETFPYDIAMELVVDPRYSANCGTIAVGISDNHILKLLNDDNISMVIPYHKSGLNHTVAKMRNIDLYVDYTKIQNTRFANGKKLEKVPDFDFYGDLYGIYGKEGTHDPKKTAENYLKWCDENNYIPKFEKSITSRKFRDNPNYYKLLIDFRVYDTDGTYREQQAVKPIYPANEEFKDLILNGVVGKDGKVYGGLKQQQGTANKLDAEAKQIIDEYRERLKEKHGKDVLGTQYADRATIEEDTEYMRYVDSWNKDAAQKMVDNAAKKSGAILDENGNPLKLYRGTTGGQTIFAKETTLNGKIYTIDNIDVATKYGDKSGKATEIAYQTEGEKTTYALYGFPKNMLTIDAQYGVWSDLVVPKDLLKYSDGRYKATNAEISEWAELEGYDALRIDNVRDGSFDAGSEIIFFDENLVKSADAITKDGNGNVIPLSQRFNEENNDIRYSDRDFAQQVDAVLNGADTTSTHLRIAEHTPKILMDIGLSDKPLLITSAHTKTALGYNVNGKNIHNISKDVFVNLPQLIKKPAIVMESTKQGSIVMFVNALDVDNNPILCAIKLDGRGNYNNVEIDANVVTSVYGKDTNPVGFVEKAVDENRLLYWDKKMSQELFDTPGLQLSDNINNFDSNVIIRKLNQEVKENDVKYSDRDNVSVYDKMGETKKLIKGNEMLKEDVEMLKERLKLEGKVTHGEYFNQNQLNAVAGHIRSLANSNFDKKILASLIDGIYKYISHSPDLNWQDMFAQCYDVARMVVDEAKPVKIKNDYNEHVLKQISGYTLYANETQIKEAEYKYGKHWRNKLKGRFTITSNPSDTSINRMWETWSSEYSNVFDKDVSDASQLADLIGTVDSLKEATEIAQEYDVEEQTRYIAYEIYNKFWTVQPVRTTADKYTKQIKQLNFKHRQAMSKLRADRDAKLQAQHKYDKQKANELYKNLRERKDKEIAEVKELGKKRLDAYKENAERKTKIQSVTANALTLNKWLTKNSKEYHVHEAMKGPVTKLLQSIDFSSKQLLGMEGSVIEKRGTPTRTDISLSKALSQVKDMMADASVGKEELIELYGHGLNDEIKALVDSVDNMMRTVGDNEFVLNKMSVDELATLDKVVKTIKHAVSTMNKFHTVNHAKGIASLSQEQIEYADSLGKEKVYDPKTLKASVSKLINWDNKIPYYAFKQFGESGKKMFEAFQDGWDKLSFNAKEIIDYAEKTYSNKEITEWTKDIKTFDIQLPATDMDLANPDYKPKSKKVQMTVPQIMSLYCSMKREQAKNHILQGGIRVADITMKNGRLLQDAEGITLTPSDIENITSTLTARQKQVADELQKFMNNECAAWGNEVSMRRFGYKAFGEDNYFPIESDANNLTGNDAPQENGNSLFKLLNMSFTKNTIEGANNRIVIKDIFDVFASHSSDMAKYNALALPVLDANRWYNYTEKIKTEDERFITKSVKASIENAFGKEGKKYITTFLEDINGQKNVGRDTLGKSFFSKAKVVSVAANLRVAMLQPTAFLKASAIIDGKYLTKALAHKPKYKHAEKYCGMALWKSLGYYDTDISKGLTEKIKHQETWKDKAVEKSMKGAEWGDKITFGYLWNACELEVRDTQKDLKVGSEEFFDTVAKRLREVIYATQVVDSTMTRSQMMRSGSMYEKMLTAFSSEPTLAFNMLQDAYVQTKQDAKKMGKKEALKKNGKMIARVVTAYTITNAVAALIESGFDAFRDDDDEEMDAAKFMEYYLTNFLTDMSISGKIPYVKEFVSIAQGFSSSRSDTQWMQTFANVISNVYKMSQGDGNPSKMFKDGIKLSSFMSGLPFYNAYRDMIAALDKLDILTSEELEELLDDLFG